MDTLPIHLPIEKFNTPVLVHSNALLKTREGRNIPVINDRSCGAPFEERHYCYSLNSLLTGSRLPNK
jgi:hypothetical protein